jgi:DNA-binding MarR family transcriptional regulator
LLIVRRSVGKTSETEQSVARLWIVANLVTEVAEVATKKQLDAMAVADRLRPTLLHLARELRREKIGGVSPQQVGLLVSIKYSPGITVGELASEERVSTAAMSKRVTRLERDGLVERTPSDTDRRCTGLSLSDEGQRTLRRVRSRRTAWLASRLGLLTADELTAVGSAVDALTRLLADEEGRR